MTYDDNNIFAKILRSEIPSERVYEDENTLVFMDIMPRSNGHVLIIPKSPVRNIFDASPAQLAACLEVVQKLSHSLMKAFAADGITLQQFNEEAGGQEVFHLHFHVLPRYNGERMKPPGVMEDTQIIKDNAALIRAALEST